MATGDRDLVRPMGGHAARLGRGWPQLGRGGVCDRSLRERARELGVNGAGTRVVASQRSETYCASTQGNTVNSLREEGFCS